MSMTWCVHVCDMTHACVWHDACMCVTLTHFRKWHDTLIHSREYHSGMITGSHSDSVHESWVNEACRFGITHRRTHWLLRYILTHWLIQWVNLWHDTLTNPHSAHVSGHMHTWQCCSVSQCVTVCCSVLQCVPVCSSVFQCVAVCDTCTHSHSWVDINVLWVRFFFPWGRMHSWVHVWHIDSSACGATRWQIHVNVIVEWLTGWRKSHI